MYIRKSLALFLPHAAIVRSFSLSFTQLYSLLTWDGRGPLRMGGKVVRWAMCHPRGLRVSVFLRTDQSTIGSLVTTGRVQDARSAGTTLYALELVPWSMLLYTSASFEKLSLLVHRLESATKFASEPASPDFPRPA